MWTTDREEIPIALEYLNDASRVTYPHNCRSIDLSRVRELVGKHIRELFIDANLGSGYSLEIRLKGKSLNCRRNIKDHNSFLSGHSIKLEENGTTMSYNVDISPLPELAHLYDADEARVKYTPMTAHDKLLEELRAVNLAPKQSYSSEED